MQNTARRLLVLVATITVTYQIPAKAGDWNISTPVTVNSGYENDRVVVNTDIKAIENNQAVIRVDGSLGGIKVEANKSIQTVSGFWKKDDNTVNEDGATINVKSGSQITGSIENRGYIRSGVNVSGQISTATGSSLLVQGTDSNNKAVVLQSFNVRNSGSVRSQSDHAINVRQHGFIDFINVERTGSIIAEGVNKSAVYVGDSGVLGGGLAQQISNGDILFYSGENSDPVMNVSGKIISNQGSGIKVDVGGTSRGSITINRGEVRGKKVSGDAGIYIAGDHFGQLQNYYGKIYGGIVISGKLIAPIQTSPVDFSTMTELQDSDRSAYSSAGGILSGGFTILESGLVESGNNHTLYLHNKSTTDKIEVRGTLDSSAIDKSAIYVADNAMIGNHTTLDAITVYTGGKIRSLQGTAIKVNGSLKGKVAVRGGMLGDNRDRYALDFSTADTALDLYQENGSTIGSILGSDKTNDKVTILGGTVDSKLIYRIESLIVRNATLNTDDLNWEVSSNNSSLTVNTAARLTINGNFTLPKTTTVEVEQGYQQSESIISVDGTVTANSNTSNIFIKPTSENAYTHLIKVGEVTLLDYRDESTLPENLLATSTDGPFAPTLSALFNVTPEIDRENKVVKAKVTASSFDVLVNSLDIPQIYKTYFLKAYEAARLIQPDSILDPAKQEILAAGMNAFLSKYSGDPVLLIANLQPAAIPLTSSVATPASTDITVTLEQLKQDIISFVEPFLTQHDTTNMTSQSLTDVHEIVTTRMDSVGIGYSFGDDFYGYESYDEGYYENEYGPGFSFFNGALWGQLIYNTSKHDKVEHDFGFKSTMSGFVIGADTDLTSDTRIGGAGSWTRSSVTGDHNTSATVNNYMASLYSQWHRDGWFTQTIVTIGRGKSDTGKVILGNPVNASYESQFRGLNVAVGHMFSNGVWNISPQGEVNISTISFDTFTETGSSGYEQKIKIDDYKTRELGAGFTLSLSKDQGYNVYPSFSLMGFYDLIDTGNKIETTYLGGSSGFIINGPSRDRLRVQTGLGVDVDLMDSWILSANYNLSWSKNFQSHNFSAKARYEF